MAKRATISAKSRVKQLASAAYREAILEAAERVFVRVGYREAKMTDLAAEAGVAIGTLYNYVESKEHVFQLLLERNNQAFLEALEEAARGCDDPIERLVAIISRLLEHIEAKNVVVQLCMQLGAHSEADLAAVGGPAMENSYLRYLDLLCTAATEAVEQGALRSDISPQRLAGALAGIVNAAVYDWMRLGQKSSLSKEAGGIIDLFFKGASKG